jgi:hypothetical protein
MLESCTSSDERVSLCRLLAATGSADATGYILDAIAEESDEAALTAIRESLEALDHRLRE